MTTETRKRKIVLMNVEKLYPHPKNAKKHPEAQLEKLAKSIKKFGIANPPNIKPSGEIITGVGRWTAVTTILGWKKIPVDVRDDLTDAEADALRISDNQVVSNDYDTELLKESMMELSMAGFDDMGALGFDEAEITRMTSDFGSIDGDVFVEDITEAVETQRAENEAKEAEIDKSAAPVSDALGFKRVTVEQSRQIREAMTAIGAKYPDKSPVDALLIALRDAA